MYRSATPVTDVERVRLPAVVTCITRCPRIHPHASNPVDHPAYHARRIRAVLHQMKTKTHLSSFSPAQPSSAPPRPSTFSTSTPPANDILRVLANVCIRHLTILQSLRWNYDPGQSKLEIRCENLAHSQQEMVPWANLVDEPGRWLCITQGPEPHMDAYGWAKPVANVEAVRPPAVVALAMDIAH